jgi:ribose transport system substrate-binding protein
MKMNVRLSTAVALAALVTSASPGISLAQDSHTIGATTYSRSFEFYQDIEAGMKEEGGDQVAFDFRDPNGDLAVQTAHMEDFVAKGVDLVTMVPIDSTAGEAAARLVTSADIPLITVDIAITADVGQVAHIASDNHYGGEIAAEKMAELLGGKGEVLVINNPAIISVVDREKGFSEKLAEIAPDVKIVASQSGDSKREKAQAVAEGICSRLTRMRRASSPLTTKWASARCRPLLPPAGRTRSASSASTQAARASPRSPKEHPRSRRPWRRIRSEWVRS